MMFSLDELEARASAGLLRRQKHPHLDLWIYNYTEKCTYEGAWDEFTLACRGLILTGAGRVIARPFPKFFNHGEAHAPELDLDAPAVVTEKMDGSLGILYPNVTDTERWRHSIEGFSIATRGSFTSDQALHATAVLQERYGDWTPDPYSTYLFEIIYPENRIVVDYQGLDDLVLLGALDTASGDPSLLAIRHAQRWAGPVVETHEHKTLRAALEAPPRPGQEGFVVFFPEANCRVKLKQEEYLALHRILTGTNARDVWEIAAVRECKHLIREPKHWGSYLGIGPERAAQILELGDDWMAGVPDEFYGWVRGVTEAVTADAHAKYQRGLVQASVARDIEDRADRFNYVQKHVYPRFVTQVMRLASATDPEAVAPARVALLLRAWRAASPAPTSPFTDREATS